MKLNYRRTFLVGLAFMTVGLFWQLYESIIPLILKHTFEISDTLAGVIMALDNVLALFLLPLFGILSDRTSTRLGRRVPFILFGSIATVIGMITLPVFDQLRSLALFLAALGFTLLATSSYRSAAVALMPDVTPKPLRSKANAIINLMGTVGGILSLSLIALTVRENQTNYLPLFSMVALLMLVSVLVLTLTIRERKLIRNMDQQIEEEKTVRSSEAMSPEVRTSFRYLLISVFLWFMGYNAITTAFSKYAQIYWGLEGGLFAYTLMIAQVVAILSFIPAGLLAARIGRRKTILGGIILMAIAFGVTSFYQNFSAALFFFFALAGAGWASINVNSYPMVVEISRDADVGKYTGIYYTYSMSAQIVTPILSGALLDYVGYWTLFPYGTLFVCFSFFTMFAVKHGDNRPPAIKKRKTYEATST